MATNGDRAHHEPHPEESRPSHGGPDTTLGGYFLEHRRPPGFEGADGEPYTVSLEAEKTPNLAAPFDGYLVFPRWAATGLGVTGHVETPTLVSGRTREGVMEELGRIPLGEVKALLDRAIALRAVESAFERPGTAGRHGSGRSGAEDDLDMEEGVGEGPD